MLIKAQRVGYCDLIGKRATAGNAIVLRLRRSLSISGRVRDAATGELIHPAEAEVGIAMPGTDRLRWIEMPATFAVQGRLQSEVDVERWPEFRIRVRAKGYEAFESRMFRGNEGQVEYDVPMQKTNKPQ